MRLASIGRRGRQPMGKKRGIEARERTSAYIWSVGF